MKVAVRRVHLRSLGKMGCLLGVVAAFLPSLLCGLLGVGLVRLFAGWLEGWEELTIHLLGQEVIGVDLVQLLGMERALAVFQALTSASGAVLFLAVLLLALGAGLLLAAIVILVGLGYNLLAATTGGLVVEMSAISQQEDREIVE